MQLSQNGIDLIKSFEGCVLHAYKPVSTERYWTIGFGHYGSDVREEQVISQQEAETLLKFDLRVFEYAVNNQVKTSITQNQFDALVSFCYNVGKEALRTSTLLKLVNDREFISASNEFDKWVHAGGKVLNGLVKRRKAEKELFLTDVSLSPSSSVSYPNITLKEGSRGQYVEMSQRALNHALGKAVLTVDGVFGKKTKQEVMNYQKRHGLTVDGIIGKQTWNMLF
jgi:GH24 family phage-related lysozyme (muramidase)